MTNDRYVVLSHRVFSGSETLEQFLNDQHPLEFRGMAMTGSSDVTPSWDNKWWQEFAIVFSRPSG